MNKLLLLLILSFTIPGLQIWSTIPVEPFTITAYVPGETMHTLSGYNLSMVDRIIYFGVGIRADGSIAPVPSSHIPILKTWKEQFGIKIYLGIVDHSGLRTSDPRGFNGILRVPPMEQNFIQSVHSIASGGVFHGIDINWEWPDPGWETQEFGKLLYRLTGELDSSSFGVSVAMSPWQVIDKHVANRLTTINLMLYDNLGYHSTYPRMVQDLDRFMKTTGIHPSRISPGLPYYGRGIGTHGRTWYNALSYRTMQRLYQFNDEQDVVGGFYFNNKKTLQEKVTHSLKTGLGGVMIWHLGMDIHAKDSLTQVIRSTINVHTGEPGHLWVLMEEVTHQPLFIPYQPGQGNHEQPVFPFPKIPADQDPWYIPAIFHSLSMGRKEEL